jgi:ATP-dependent exoDNAse (exonuclease V) beta subunit
MDRRSTPGKRRQRRCAPSPFRSFPGRKKFLTEAPVYGRLTGEKGQLVSGRADAVRYRDDGACIVFDWKSDLAPDTDVRHAYARQLAIYVDALRAERGPIVYMTSGAIEWVAPPVQR